MIFTRVLFILLFSLDARAEYRAYLLAINNTQTNQTRTVISTIDHIQYNEFYLVRQAETIRIADTWMCWGRQGDFKAVCPSPRPPPDLTAPPTQPTARTPASAKTR